MERRQFIQSIAASALAAGARPLLPLAEAAEKSVAAGQIAAAGQAEVKSDAAREFFFRPADAWTMDVIPFYRDGRFHLFFLLDWRDVARHGEGLPWFQVSTTDFVHFVEHGEMLARGTKDEQDLTVCTGSVAQGEGKYHIWYAGDNPAWKAKGKPQEAAMHAVSDDLLHWTKVPEDSFNAPSDLYDRDDWRDPFVFRNEEAGEYWMLVAARTKTGPSRRRGCTALCVSKDLKKWDVREPLYAPGLYRIHECPDMFKMGDWWYLVFSEYTDLIRTRYRMSRSSKGPWTTPEDDCFDGRALYAAKTASDGQHRYLFGWDPTRAGNKDYGTWDWGGNLVVHELKQEADGTLSVHLPATIDAAFSKPLAAPFPFTWGNVKVDGNQVEVAATEPGELSFACAASDVMPDRCKIEAQVEFDEGTRGCGIMLRTSDDLDSSYYIRLEPKRNRMVFDCWPRVTPGPPVGGHLQGLERWIKLEPGVPVDLKIIVADSIAVVYVNNRIAMSLRMYDLPVGRWGLFANGGSARFRNIKISAL